MDAITAFKVGFLARCAAEGLSEQETLSRVKSAANLSGLTGRLADIGIGAGIGSIAGPQAGLGVGAGATAGATVGSGLHRNLWEALKYTGLLGASLGALGVAAPAVGGGLVGYGLGRAGDIEDQDIEEFKQRELIAEYDRLAEQARRQRAARQYGDERARTRF